MDTESKAPSSYVTTITTAVDSDHQSSSESMFVLRVIHSEMERKLEELRDVHKAYAFLTTNWTEDKNAVTNPSQHCYRVQQAWHHSTGTYRYSVELEEAAETLEGEIAGIRRELAQYGLK
ncbi:hypothetical protein BGX29_010964 [Mortierella sp. GBA35]|nr:hypothetical protein BGX29_010964 [Mortierella sp. GBA35]